MTGKKYKIMCRAVKRAVANVKNAMWNDKCMEINNCLGSMTMESTKDYANESERTSSNLSNSSWRENKLPWKITLKGSWGVPYQSQFWLVIWWRQYNNSIGSKSCGREYEKRMSSWPWWNIYRAIIRRARQIIWTVGLCFQFISNRISCLTSGK